MTLMAQLKTLYLTRVMSAEQLPTLCGFYNTVSRATTPGSFLGKNTASVEVLHIS